MKIEVSTSVAGLLRTTPLEEALETVRDAGIRLIDFPINVFSRPEGSPIKSDHWLEWTGKLREKLDDMGLTVSQAHASWEQAIPEDFRFEEPYPVYERTIRVCHMLGCSKLVFHAPLYFFRTPDEATRRKVTEWNIRWFRCLVPLLEQYGVTAELENTFDYRRVRREGDPPFIYTSAEDMLELRDGIGSDHVKICLDTGHANIYGQDPAMMIRKYGEKLGVLHLNDNFGLIQPVYEDLHLFPGYGNLHWNEIFGALKDTGFTGIFNMEPVGSLGLISRELRVIQFRSAVEFVKRAAAQAGFEA